ncbi:MAG: glycosyltransferase family 2 protein [Planctomycetota bacterium]
MSATIRALLTLLLPIVALAAIAFAVLLTLLDLLATPLLLLLRRPPRDERPRTRDASIVVLNWNGVDFLKELMPSLRVAVERCPGDHEVIVVDNGSSDDSIAWLTREHPWAKRVSLPENLHFIRGNAAGAKAATRDLIVYLNNDMRVEPDWLVELLRPFVTDTAGDLFATTSRIEMQGQRKETGLARCFVKKGELRFVQPAGTDADDGAPVLWAGGGCSAFDRHKHDAIGGFERLYVPCYVEDVSLSYQAWRRGWRAIYCHRSVVHHAHRGSSAKVFSRAALERLDWRNRELFFVRSVTDPRLVLAHGLWLWWNLPKRARQLELTVADGVLALLATLPRLPAALWQRQTARRAYRRSDAAVLRTTATTRGA